MNTPKLFRKRLIPDECLELKDDTVLFRDEQILVTKWNTIRPKKTLHHGYSCYFLTEGVKVSKFYDRDNRLISWYCDIVTHSYDACADAYLFTDLLADVIVYPDGQVRVVDLDELADALEENLLAPELLQSALRQLDWLLSRIYSGGFRRLQETLETYEAST